MEYLQQRVLADLNIQNPRIGKDASNCPNLPGGMLLTAREWAKFGQFVLDQGKVRAADGTMIQRLQPDLLAQCFVASEKNPSYGLTWWLNINAESTLIDARVADSGGPADADASKPDAPDDARARNRARIRQRIMDARREQEANRLGADAAEGPGVRVYMAAGLGKQRLYVLPDQDLVIVRFAEATDKGRAFSDAEFLGLALGRVAANEGASE
jgi:CubicO group peptidase (beta-lactamase class C family)